MRIYHAIYTCGQEVQEPWPSAPRLGAKLCHGRELPSTGIIFHFTTGKLQSSISLPNIHGYTFCQPSLSTAFAVHLWNPHSNFTKHQLPLRWPIALLGSSCQSRTKDH